MQPMDAGTRALLATEHVAQLARSRREHAWPRQLRRRMTSSRPRTSSPAPSTTVVSPQHPPPLRHPRIRGARQPGGGRRARSRRAQRGRDRRERQEEPTWSCPERRRSTSTASRSSDRRTMVFVRDRAARGARSPRRRARRSSRSADARRAVSPFGGRGDARHAGVTERGTSRAPSSAPAGARRSGRGARPSTSPAWRRGLGRTDDVISHLRQAIEDDDRSGAHPEPTGT